MKELRIQVKDTKYQFLLELLRNLDFVTVSDEKETVIQNIESGFKEMQAFKQGKTKGTALSDFLNEV